jgi:2-methylcitrate dehydratase PrpD
MLARFAADLRYEGLPSEAVATLKKLFLDTVATALAGITLGAGCAEVMQVVRAAAGTPESILIGFGLKAPALTAAFHLGKVEDIRRMVNSAPSVGVFTAIRSPLSPNLRQTFSS